MKIYTGTSGYGYKPWKGKFYPRDLPDKEMLSYYSCIFPAVEINNTFYSMPVKSTLGAWLNEVPARFKFILKAPMEITHRKRLKDCSEPLKYFLDTASVLKKNLAGFLFQLPPNFKKNSERLNDFLNLLPAGTKSAVEFRHESWFDEEVYQLLKKRKSALCIADTDEIPFKEIIATTDWGYLRLRKENYTNVDLHSWSKKILSQKWKHAYIFFKHEDKANGPRFGMQLQELLKK